MACFTWSGKIACEKLLLYGVDEVFETAERKVFRKVADIPYISLYFLLLRKFMFYNFLLTFQKKRSFTLRIFSVNLTKSASMFFHIIFSIIKVPSKMGFFVFPH